MIRSKNLKSIGKSEILNRINKIINIKLNILWIRMQVSS